MSNNPPAFFPDNPLTRMLTDRNGFPVNGSSLPSTRSAALGKPLPAPLPPLSPEERAELDRKAIELGIMPPSETEMGSNYKSQEEAVSAGQPVVKEQPAQSRVEYRLPDFTKIRAIDLTRDLVIIGTLEFKISKEDSAEFKKFAINVAREAVEKELTDALSILRQEDNNNGLSAGEDLQQVQGKEKPK